MHEPEPTRASRRGRLFFGGSWRHRHETCVLRIHMKQNRPSAPRGPWRASPSTSSLGLGQAAAVSCCAFRRGSVPGLPPHPNPPQSPSLSRPHLSPLYPPTTDHSACTLGRRPDTFNGDAERLPASFPNFPADPIGSAPHVPGSATLPLARSSTISLDDDAGAAASPSVVSAFPSAAAFTAVTDAAASVAAWCSQLQRLHSAAQSMHHRLDALLHDLDSLDLATGPDLHRAERMHKVITAYLSLARSGSREGKKAMATTTASTKEMEEEEGGPGAMRLMLCRLEAAFVQLAAIGARHAADVYSPLRRFYFSPDEPLRAIAMRSEAYRRQLERAATACGPDSPQVAAVLEEVAAAMSSRTVAAFSDLDQWDRGRGVDGGGGRGGGATGGQGGDIWAAGASAEVYGMAASAAGDSKGDVAYCGNEAQLLRAAVDVSAPCRTSHGGIDGVGVTGALEQLAAAAAADYWALQELRQEMEIVRHSAEAAGVPIGELLQLADRALEA